MSFNASALISGIGAVAGHPITKGTALATVVTAGLYTASAAGLVIPGWAFFAGPVLGTLLYKFLPPKIQEEIDNTTEKVVDTFNEIPNTYQEYPVDKNMPIGTPNNIKSGNSE